MGDLASPPPQSISDELTCIECGYALRGLNAAGACPECATPIGKSIRGSDLSYADPLFVARLPLSMAAGIIGDAAAIASTLILWLPYAASVQWTYGDSTSDALQYGVVVFAYWSSAYLLALPKASFESHGPSLSMLSRWLLIMATLTLILTLFEWGFYPPHSRAFKLLDIAIGVATTVLYYTLMLRFARLAADRFLTRHIPLVLMLTLLNHLVIEIIPWLNLILQASGTTTTMDSALQVMIYLASVTYALVVSVRAYKIFSRAATAARDNWNSSPSPSLG